MKLSDDDSPNHDGPTSIEQQHTALESAPTPAPAENLDTDFDDPRLAGELKKSQQMLENQFADLAYHLDAASRLAKQIRTLVDERLS